VTEWTPAVGVQASACPPPTTTTAQLPSPNSASTLSAQEVGAGYVILIQRPCRCHCHRQSKVELSLCLTNSALRHEGIWGSKCIDPGFLDLGTIWRSVVSFTPRALYPWAKSPRYPVDRRLGRPQNWSALCGEEKILATTKDSQTPTPWSSSLWPVAIPTVLSRLLSLL
jgi:hypothetical protein